MIESRDHFPCSMLVTNITFIMHPLKQKKSTLVKKVRHLDPFCFFVFFIYNNLIVEERDLNPGCVRNMMK